MKDLQINQNNNIYSTFTLGSFELSPSIERIWMLNPTSCIRTCAQPLLLPMYTIFFEFMSATIRWNTNPSCTLTSFASTSFAKSKGVCAPYINQCNPNENQTFYWKSIKENKNKPLRRQLLATHNRKQSFKAFHPQERLCIAKIFHRFVQAYLQISSYLHPKLPLVPLFYSLKIVKKSKHLQTLIIKKRKITF